MLVVQTPLRVSFFGGGTDFPSYFLEEGGCVLSSAIDKYIFVTAKRRFDDKVRVGYTKTEMVDDVDELQHELIREALKKTGIRKRIEITTMADIPSAGCGLGSSSTVTVGALHALYAFLGRQVPAHKLAEEACQIELEALQRPIGIQDQYIAAYGGFRFMEFGTDRMVAVERIPLNNELRERLDERLLLFYTGVTRNSASILSEQRSNIHTTRSVLGEMKDLAHQARAALLSGRLDEFGHLMHVNWMLKRRLASKVSNPEIDSLYEAAVGAGAIGGKITGAGGGGFLLLYCAKEIQDRVRASLGGLKELRFRLERDGSKTIFNYRRAYADAPTVEPTELIKNPIRLNWAVAKLKEVKPVEVEAAPTETGTSTPAAEQVSNGDPASADYVAQLQRLLGRLHTEPIEQMIDLLHETRINHRQVIIMGNGGSASTASHFACDLGKNTRCEGWPDFRVVSLADNLAGLTACANDEGYENIFAAPLSSIVLPDDVVIGISTSGNSPNVLRAMEVARQNHATTIGLTGFDGGRLRDLVDIEVHIPSDCIEPVEDLHLMVEHIATKALRERAEAGARSKLRESQRDGIGQSHREEPLSVPENGSIWADRVRTLLRVNQALSTELAWDLTLRSILQVMLHDLGARSGSVFLLDENEEPLAGEVAFDGQVASRTPDEVREILTDGLAGWVVRNRHGALMEDASSDPRWLRRDPEKEAPDKRSAISVPLIVRDKPRAVLTLTRGGPGGFSQADLEFLNTVALCVSLAPRG